MTKPQYAQLYLALGAISLIGMASHCAVTGPLTVKIVDIAFSLALFTTLLRWMHVNQRALTQPDASDGRIPVIPFRRR